MCASYENEGESVEDQLRFGIDVSDPTSLDPSAKVRIRCGAIALQMKPSCSVLDVQQQRLSSPSTYTFPTEDELAAVAEACSKTGAPVMLLSHPFRWKEGVHIIQKLHAIGTPLERIVLCGTHAGFDQSYESQVELLAKGVNLCFDCFGRATTDSPTDGIAYYSSDTQNIQRIIDLAKAGYAKHIVVSQGVVRKNHLRRYGGPGYVDIHRILSSIHHTKYMDGLSQGDMMCIKAANAWRLLNWYIPPPAVTPQLITVQCYICKKCKHSGVNLHVSVQR